MFLLKFDKHIQTGVGQRHLGNKKPTPVKREWVRLAIVRGPARGAGPSPSAPIGAKQDQTR